jgi:hypothetical protein
MRQLERWYDVEVAYEGKILKKKFYGEISRYNNASKILQLLEKTGCLRFRMEGKKILVTQSFNSAQDKP